MRVSRGQVAVPRRSTQQDWFPECRTGVTAKQHRARAAEQDTMD